MPIQFRCNHCRQRLAAPTRKAGSNVACPRCGEQIEVPKPVNKPVSGSTNAATPAPPASSSPPPLKASTPPPVPHSASEHPAKTAVEENTDSDWQVFPDTTVSRSTKKPSTFSSHRKPLADEESTSEYVGVSRLTLFLQGVLIAIVAFVFFVAGMFVGRNSGVSGQAIVSSVPVELSGRVVFRTSGRRTPDSNAVVLLIPQTTQPDQKLPAEGLRASDKPISDLHASIKEIRHWGGDYIKADTGGRFRLKAPKSGPFFLLVISANVDRRGARPELSDLAEIGRYFLPAVDLLGDQAYQWQSIRIVGTKQLPEIVIASRR